MKLLAMLFVLMTMPAGRAAQFAITMDDFNVGETTLLAAGERNERILHALATHQVKGALFVVCRHVEDDAGRKLLRQWSQAGHWIGNHTYTHPRFGSATSYQAFAADAERCHQSLKDEAGFQPLFRFPMLAEGDTAAKRDLMREWLRAHRYRTGHVSIDASDWYVDQRLREKLRQDPHFDLSKFRDFYLDHMWQRATYYNELSKKVLGREVKHTVLVHFNLLNALYLGDLIAMFERRGWQIVDASDAFSDPVYQLSPRALPSGQSLLWGLARESGRFEAELRYPGEDGEYEKAEMDRRGL